MQTGWAWEELETVKLWDPRCRHSLVRACEMLAEKAELSFSRALGGLRKAVSGILHKESVTSDALLKGHIRATRRRCEGRELVLVASDTTTLDFTTHKATTGLGGITTNPRSQGFLAHSALAMTTDGTPPQLGGFRSVPSAPDPGVKSLWLGFRKLRDMLIGFQLARSRPISP